MTGGSRGGRERTSISKPRMKRPDLYWLAFALLLPATVCLTIIIYGLIAISPTVNTGQCPLGYNKCGNLSTCVAQEHVCDAQEHCDNGADEDPLLCSNNQGSVAVILQMILGNHVINNTHACDLYQYPDDCVCQMSTSINCRSGSFSDVPNPLSINTTMLILDQNSIHFLNNTSTFQGLFLLNRLYICDNDLAYIKPGVFDDLNQLQWLLLTNNKLRIIEAGVLEILINLRYLDLSGNLLTLTSPEILYVPRDVHTLVLENNHIMKLTRNTFRLAKEAKVLLLGYNQIHTIHPEAFHPVINLDDLDLQYNNLKTISSKILQYDHKLTMLTLDFNPLDVTTVLSVLQHTQSLISLGLRGVDLEGGNLHSITSMRNLTYAYFKTHRYCRYAPHVHVCQPKGDGISSLTNLLDHESHRICIWLIIILTIGGNLLVIIFRYLKQGENNIYTLFITHICTADIMTGMFLLIIAVYDVILRDEFNRHALWWITSWTCTGAGVLGLMASEVSVMILALVALERYVSVAYPFRATPLLTYNTACVLLLVIWILGLVLAILPLASHRVFGDFYSTNAVCYPLFIDAPLASGWEYSCFIILGLNFTALIMVCYCYFGLFLSLNKMSSTSRAGSPGNTNLARRLMSVVLVYFLCLVPVIVTKILALGGVHIESNAYAWLTVFVVPVNSTFNPLIYTVCTPYFCRQFRHYVPRGRASVTSFTLSSSDSSRRVTGSGLFSYLSDETPIADRPYSPVAQEIDTTTHFDDKIKQG